MMRIVVVLVGVVALAGSATSRRPPTPTPTHQPETDAALAEVRRAHKRIDMLVAALNLHDSVKASWWCSFLCFRSKALCSAVEERADQPQECIPRRRVYCRNFGRPAMWDNKGPIESTMTCHTFLSSCEKAAHELGGGAPCLGVE